MNYLIGELGERISLALSFLVTLGPDADLLASQHPRKTSARGKEKDQKEHEEERP